jgi:hypothetical protein
MFSRTEPRPNLTEVQKVVRAYQGQESASYQDFVCSAMYSIHGQGKFSAYMHGDSFVV